MTRPKGAWQTVSLGGGVAAKGENAAAKGDFGLMKGACDRNQNKNHRLLQRLGPEQTVKVGGGDGTKGEDVHLKQNIRGKMLGQKGKMQIGGVDWTRYWGVTQKWV